MSSTELGGGGGERGGERGDFQENMVYNNTLIQKYHTVIAIL